MRVFWSTALLVAFASVTTTFAAELKLRPPSQPFESYPAPPAPNYNDASAWAVWPGRASKADVIPPGIKGEIAKTPKADVFFIHPTTYLTNDTWNARFDQGDFTGQQLEDGVLRYQTSVFNGCCRMFVPRYRQTTLSAFLNPGADANKAYDLAYSDVLRAFDHFTAKENNGRPFILASHSQGSLHATRLLKDRILADGDLRKRIVVAYVIGTALPDNIEQTGLPICNSPRQTRCLVNWNSVTALTPLALGRGMMMTYDDGRYQTVGRKTWSCVNPLSWDRTTITPASANKGALPLVELGRPMPRVMAGVTGAKCSRGRLVISIPRALRAGFKDPLTTLGSYHNQDYSLFYGSIRRNAIARVEAFGNR